MKWKYWIVVTLSLVVSLSVAGRDRHGIGMAAALPGSSNAVSVVLDADQTIDDGILLGLDRELRRIFYGTAMPVELVIPDLNAHPEFSNEILIARVRGVCRIDAMPPLQAHRADTLGRTLVTDGRILPYIELDCRQISGAVKKQLIGQPTPVRHRLLGRAMARVLAHEIYHVLAQTHEHGPHGVAAESFNGDDLVRERLDFRFEELEAMGLVPTMATH